MNEYRRVRAVPKLPRREREGHKGSYGHVLVVGGSPGMIGAPALAANACLRAGAGLVTVAVPEGIQQAVAVLCPCATSVRLACDGKGQPHNSAVRQLLEQLAGCDVLAMGPGFGLTPGYVQLVRAALEQEKPAVLDASGLHDLCAIGDWPSRRHCPLVLTPHPGEFGRLAGVSPKDVQKDRLNLAVTCARRWAGHGSRQLPLILVLKGAGTIVTDGRRVYVNGTGNPGMATGGAGDVLTGVIAALIGQGLAPFEAAVLGVNVHGRAGDLAARDLGEVSMIASDLLDYLPRAMKATMRA